MIYILHKIRQGKRIAKEKFQTNMEGTPSTSPCHPAVAVDRFSITSDPFISSYPENSKVQDLVSCPKNIDDFLALYRHEEWSIQEFLDCLEEPKPSRNMYASRSGECTAHSVSPRDIGSLSDSAMSVPKSAAAQPTVQSSNVSRASRDSLRAEIRRYQNRISQQRYRDKLKQSALPHVPRSWKAKSRPQPFIHSPENMSSGQRLHMAMLTILGSSRETEARIFQR